MTVSFLRKVAGDFTTVFVSFISKLYWFLNLALPLSNWNLLGLTIISLTLNHLSILHSHLLVPSKVLQHIYLLHNLYCRFQNLQVLPQLQREISN